MRLVALVLTLSLLVAVGCEDRRSPTDQAVGWFPPSQRAAARCIVLHESTNNPRAVSPGGGNLGLFQINRVHAAAFQRLTHKSFNPGAFDPRLNGQFARFLWNSTGWAAWSTHRRCGV